MLLKAAREKRGWTQEYLAEKSGVNQATISRIERYGSPAIGLTVAHGLATALEMPISDLDFSPRATLEALVAAENAAAGEVKA